jgi:hypothetical protein
VEEGAWFAAVELVASYNDNKTISCEFGMKIKPLPNSLKNQMVVNKDPANKIIEIIAMSNH